MRDTASRGTGRSMSWCPLWASLMRSPFNKTKDCSKPAPRIDKSEDRPPYSLRAARCKLLRFIEVEGSTLQIYPTSTIFNRYTFVLEFVWHGHIIHTH
jgi:hypothetical protein